MTNDYWKELIAKSCDADWRHVSTLPAAMVLWADGMLEGDGDK